MTAHEAPSLLLHATHDLGGGSHTWLRSFCDADLPGGNLLLRARARPEAGDTLLQVSRGETPEEVLEEHPVPIPPRGTVARSPELAAVLDELTRRYPLRGVLVSSWISSSLDLLRTGLPTGWVLHDFHPLCAAVHLHFDGACTECPTSTLGKCLAGNPVRRAFPPQDAASWEGLRRELLAEPCERDALLFLNSPSSGRILGALWPESAVLPRHTLSLEARPWLEPLPPRPERDLAAPLRGLVPGRLDLHKGAELLRRVLHHAAPEIEFLLLGSGPRGRELATLPRVRAVAGYRREHLRALVHTLAPDVALLPAVSPETYGYVLSELRALGVPTLATRLGAFLDRIEDGVDGFLEDPDPERLAARLAALRDAPETLEAARAALARTAAPGPATPAAGRRALGLPA